MLPCDWRQHTTISKTWEGNLDSDMESILYKPYQWTLHHRDSGSITWDDFDVDTFEVSTPARLKEGVSFKVTGKVIGIRAMYESWKYLSVEVMVNGGSVKIQQVLGDVNELATEEDYTFYGFIQPGGCDGDLSKAEFFAKGWEKGGELRVSGW
jgi:hypothetical protein